MKQLNTELPMLDVKQTKVEVENELSKYRDLLLRSHESELPIINTQNYSFDLPGKTNAFYSLVESVAIKNADKEAYRKRFTKRIQIAVNRLGYWHRLVIFRRYMTDDSFYDYEIATELGLSVSTFRRKKNEALLNLAKILHLEVFEKGSLESNTEEMKDELRTANT